ncbi:MAG: hypothetical protein LBT37_01880 [Lactobacillaceae bacterium]|nr:hypothetical protein [Lactobacillaceae bacterium]
MNIEFTIVDVYKIMKKVLLIGGILGLIVAAAGFMYGKEYTEEKNHYQARFELAVVGDYDKDISEDLMTGTLDQSLVQTYAQLVVSDGVLRNAIEELTGEPATTSKINALKKQVNVEAIQNTRLIRGSVASKTADGAIKDANAVVNATIKRSETLWSKKNLKINSEPLLDPVKVYKRPTLFAIIGFATTFVLAMIVAFGWVGLKKVRAFVKEQ